MSETAAEVEPMKPSANASSRGLVRNALTGYLSTFVGMATGFLLTPFLLHHLGTNRYGLWMLLNSTIGYVGLVEIGIGTAVAKRVAECLATGDRKRLEQVLGTAFVMYCVIAVLVMLVTAVLMFFVGRMFHLDANATHIARVCLFVLGVNQAVNFLFTSQSAILFGAGRMDLMTGVSVALSLAASLAQVALLFHGGGLVALAWITVGTTVATGCLGYWVIRKNLHSVSIKPRSATMTMMRELLKFGSRNGVINICGSIAYASDAVLLGILLPISSVTIYLIASKLANLVGAIISKPTSVLMPMFSHFDAAADASKQMRVFIKSTLFSMALAIPFVIVLCVFGDRLILAWVGHGHHSSFAILVVLALAQVFHQPGYIALTMMTGTEKNEYLVRLSLISAPINIFCSIVLTLLLGPIGVAVGSLIVVMVTSMFLLPQEICRQYLFGFGTYVKKVFLPFLFPVLVTVTLALTLRTLAPPNQTGKVLYQSFLVVIAWFSILIVAVGAERRNFMVTKLRARVCGS